MIDSFLKSMLWSILPSSHTPPSSSHPPLGFRLSVNHSIIVPLELIVVKSGGWNWERDLTPIRFFCERKSEWERCWKISICPQFPSPPPIFFEFLLFDEFSLDLTKRRSILTSSFILILLRSGHCLRQETRTLLGL